MNNIIKLEQTLHGYSDGHRMLKNSIELSDIDRRTMLMMSDLSGSGFTDDDKAYITGYPLSKAPYYVLAKTWLATEMERPGCVWTHSILVPYIDLKILDSASVFKTLFKKPNSQESFIEYCDQIHIDYFQNSTLEDTVENVFMIKEIINFLYSDDSKSIVFIKEHELPYDELVLNIWIKQWPSLRQSFSFCTGSLSNRKLSKKTLDLQLCERKNASEFKRNDANSVIVDNKNFTKEKKYPEWVILAVNNIFYGNSGTKNNSLESIYDFWGNERSKYSAYIIFEQKFKSHLFSNHTDDILETLGNLKQNEKERLIISDFLFGINSILLSKHTSSNYHNEEDLLTDLIFDPKFNSLPTESLQIRKRVEKSLNHNPGKLFNRLLNHRDHSLSVHSYEFFGTLAQNIIPSDFILLAQDNMRVGTFLVSQNPSLLCDPEIWKQKNINMKELLETVYSHNQRQVDIDYTKTLIHLMLDSNSCSASEVIYEAFKKEVICIILEWINIDDKHHIDSESDWMKILQKEIESCINWIRSNASVGNNVVLTVAGISGPITTEISTSDSKTLAELIYRIHRELTEKERNQISEFALIRSLQYEDEFSKTLVEISFRHIDHLIRRNVISWHSWSIIENFLPDVAWYEKWDRAKRLRKYLAKKRLLK